MSSQDTNELHQQAFAELASLIRNHQSDSLGNLGETAAAVNIFGYLNSLNSNVATDVFIRLLAWFRTSNDEVQNPEAFLRTMVKHAAIDQIREHEREIPTTASLFELLTEPEVGFNEQILVAEQVRHAIRTAAAYGESAIAECATVWLDMADEFGRSPTSREVAARLEVSHQTVINRLQAFEHYIGDG